MIILGRKFSFDELIKDFIIFFVLMFFIFT